MRGTKYDKCQVQYNNYYFNLVVTVENQEILVFYRIQDTV